MQPPESPFPLVLGFVGHRELPPEDEPQLGAALREVFAKFRASFPRTRLVLLSSLAQGGDRLAVATALEADVEVRIALPLTERHFLASTSFDTATERQRSEHLLGRPGLTKFTVPPPGQGWPEDTDEAGWHELATAKEAANPQAAKLRRRAYAHASGYIVGHCHALIVFWDSAPGRPAGTGESVRFKLFGQPPALLPPGAPLRHGGEVGPVIRVASRRKSSDPLPVGEIQLLLPQPDPGENVPLRGRPWAQVRLSRGWPARVADRFKLAWGVNDDAGASHGAEAPPFDECHDPIRQRDDRELAEFCATCEAVAQFNDDAAPALAAQSYEASWKKLSAPVSPGSSELVPPAADLERIARLRDLAGDLAQGQEDRVFNRQVALYALLFLSVVCFHIYGHRPDVSQSPPVHSPGWLVAFLLSVVGAVGLVLAVWAGRLDQRRLDYRALAEALRVRLHWAAAGIDRSVADAYLGQSRGAMSWARRALQSVSPPPHVWGERFGKLPAEQQAPILARVGKIWVQDQRDYFAKNQHQRHGKATGFRRAALVLTVLGWLGALTLLVQLVWPAFPTNHAGGHQPSDAYHPGHVLLLGSALAVVLGGFLNAWCEKQSHEELAHQYNRMHAVFSQGDRELTAALANGDLAQARKILEALGQEALTEHAAWLVLRRARPFELHLG